MVILSLLRLILKIFHQRIVPKISFLEIEIEESKVEYKPYLENYFNTIGGNKANLFTDISNYISYELGQPTHCFDSRID